MPATPSRPLLCAEHIAMIDKGVSAIVASRDADLRPALMRAVGASTSVDGTHITVYLQRSQSQQLLHNLAANGHVAVVFSEPLSHRTLQLKASQVSQRAAAPSDRPALQRYLRAMEHEVGLVGFDPPFVRAMLGFELDDLVAVSFHPEAAFDQTPGPKAGAALPAT